MRDHTVSELLSLPRAARRIGVTAKWLRTEANEGRVPCLRADSRYLFDVDAVTRSLAKRATSPTPVTQDEGEVSDA